MTLSALKERRREQQQTELKERSGSKRRGGRAPADTPESREVSRSPGGDFATPHDKDSAAAAVALVERIEAVFQDAAVPEPLRASLGQRLLQAVLPGSAVTPAGAASGASPAETAAMQTPAGDDGGSPARRGLFQMVSGALGLSSPASPPCASPMTPPTPDTGSLATPQSRLPRITPSRRDTSGGGPQKEPDVASDSALPCKAQERGTMGLDSDSDSDKDSDDWEGFGTPVSDRPEKQKRWEGASGGSGGGSALADAERRLRELDELDRQIAAAELELNAAMQQVEGSGSLDMSGVGSVRGWRTLALAPAA